MGQNVFPYRTVIDNESPVLFIDPFNCFCFRPQIHLNLPFNYAKYVTLINSFDDSMHGLGRIVSDGQHFALDRSLLTGSAMRKSDIIIEISSANNFYEPNREAAGGENEASADVHKVHYKRCTVYPSSTR